MGQNVRCIEKFLEIENGMGSATPAFLRDDDEFELKRVINRDGSIGGGFAHHFTPKEIDQIGSYSQYSNYHKKFPGRNPWDDDQNFYDSLESDADKNILVEDDEVLYYLNSYAGENGEDASKIVFRAENFEDAVQQIMNAIDEGEFQSIPGMVYYDDMPGEINSSELEGDVQIYDSLRDYYDSDIDFDEDGNIITDENDDIIDSNYDDTAEVWNSWEN